MAANNLQFTEHDWDFIRQAVASGAYQSESEVLRAGLRLLEAEQKPLPWDDETLYNLAKPGLDQLDRGEYTEMSIDEVAGFLLAIEEDEHSEEVA